MLDGDVRLTERERETLTALASSIEDGWLAQQLVGVSPPRSVRVRWWALALLALGALITIAVLSRGVGDDSGHPSVPWTIHEGTLGNSVVQDRAQGGEQDEALTGDERARLRELEREVAELRMDLDVLKRSFATPASPVVPMYASLRVSHAYP